MGEHSEKTAIMFVDIEGSTKLYEKLGDQKAQQIIERCLGIASDIIKKSKGTIVKFIGDEVMSRFADEDSAIEAACKIQEALENGKAREALPSVRIGLHYGTAIEKEGDVFGDAVNVAARVTAIAKGKQIITTADTVLNLSPKHVGMTREFDKTAIKGKEGEVTIYEVLWQPENATQMRTAIKSGSADAASLLSIVYDGNESNIKANAPDFMIGRDPRCDLIVNSDFSSRIHARIEYRRGKFVLVDQSTNGTYVIMENKQSIYIRREELPLVGVGTIGLGESVDDDSLHVIRFACL
ncbi:MAG: adenylate/guanylate cyclase domain-containing protein [Acidiferrobacterales bacterium]